MAGEPKARDIEDALRLRVDSLVPELLPAARVDGRFWCVGSVDGEPGQTLKIDRSGAKQGMWNDFNAGAHPDGKAGDMLKLIAIVRFGGWSLEGAKAKAIAWARSWLGWDSLDPKRLETVRREASLRQAQSEREAAAEIAKKRRRAYALWRGAAPIAGTPAERYLIDRAISFDALGRYPGAFRYCPDAWCDVRRSKHPAMIACIMALDGSLLGVHRTYLDLSAGKGGPVRNVKVVRGEDGRMRLARPGEPKAKSHKMTLGPYTGGCIPLWKGASDKTLREIPAGTAVYASEGIEDGLSVALAAPRLRVVAGVALANLGALELPPQAGELVLIGQNDPLGSKAVDAFERVVARQQDAGRRVRLMFPKPEFKDFNDQLLGKAMTDA